MPWTISLILACALGVFGLVALSTSLMHRRWARHRGGIQRGRQLALAAVLMSGFLIVLSGTNLVPLPPLLSLALFVPALACLAGYGWLMVRTVRGQWK
ncbi:hypothetical protein [Nonomuraea sp. NPDC005650]|uniref:hypothetical protein n=1 Tax=Nonomuraea sp. NPDC005650 TaxID=3157045 RepID=UPI0033B09E80